VIHTPPIPLSSTLGKRVAPEAPPQSQVSPKFARLEQSIDSLQSAVGNLTQHLAERDVAIAALLETNRRLRRRMAHIESVLRITSQ